MRYYIRYSFIYDVPPLGGLTDVSSISNVDFSIFDRGNGPPIRLKPRTFRDTIDHRPFLAVTNSIDVLL